MAVDEWLGDEAVLYDVVDFGCQLGVFLHRGCVEHMHVEAIGGDELVAWLRIVYDVVCGMAIPIVCGVGWLHKLVVVGARVEYVESLRGAHPVVGICLLFHAIHVLEEQFALVVGVGLILKLRAVEGSEGVVARYPYEALGIDCHTVAAVGLQSVLCGV